MNYTKIFIIFLFLVISVLIGQINSDARMLGLNGSYTTLAKGVRAVGINPANLAAYNINSFRMIDIVLGIDNNYLSIEQYNNLSSAHLDDSINDNYISKESILNQFHNSGLQFMPRFKLNFPSLSIANKNIAITSNIKTNINIGLSYGILQFLLKGNPVDEIIDLDLKESFNIINENSFSYAHSMKNFSMGITIKYFLGLFHTEIEPISNTTIITDYFGSIGNPQYILKQAIGGNGLGLDIGIITNESQNGYRFGIALINCIGKIKWNNNKFIRNNLGIEGIISKNDNYLRPGEFKYFNMVIDSFIVNGKRDSSIYYEVYNVIPVNDIPYHSELTIELDDGSYLFPSGGKYKYVDLINNVDTTYTISNNYSKSIIKSDAEIITREPMYLRIGFSKKWIKKAILSFDILTGFNNTINSRSNWRFSLGLEIVKYKKQSIRMGLALGGIESKSISFGYGYNIGKVYFDIGASLNGAISIYSAKGINFATGLSWIIK